MPPGTKTHQTLFGTSTSDHLDRLISSTPRPQSTINGDSVQISPHKFMTNSAINLSSNRNRSQTLPRFLNYRPGQTGITEQDKKITLEARKLAMYPAGQQRSPEIPAPIERCDWPAPPASAVVLAELSKFNL